MAAVVLGQALLGALCLPFLAVPAVESWPWIAASVVLHLGYQLFLIEAYRTGGLSEVYPLARGAAPLMVAAVSVLFLGTALSGMEWGGILLISTGLASLVIVNSSGVFKLPGRATAMALCASVFIAAYSLVDGLGARVSGSAVAFFGWVTVINALVFFCLVPLWRPAAMRAVPAAWRVVLIGGGASFCAYALVVWAFTQAPIATVAALRETSILFAIAIGVGVMGERLDLKRILAAMFTITGAVLLRLGKSL